MAHAGRPFAPEIPGRLVESQHILYTPSQPCAPCSGGFVISTRRARSCGSRLLLVELNLLQVHKVIAVFSQDLDRNPLNLYTIRPGDR
jgi:hypothetical protein